MVYLIEFRMILPSTPPSPFRSEPQHGQQADFAGGQAHHLGTPRAQQQILQQNRQQVLAASKRARSTPVFLGWVSWL